MILPDLAAVVVHHRSYDTLSRTIAALMSDGVPPARLLVVDNSEEPGRRRELEQLLPYESHVIYCRNSGYGSAVNRGASWHEDNTADWQYLLVSTHESRPYSGCLASLRAVLVEDSSTAVVGPTLVTGEDGNTVWSQGGYLTPVLGLPRHHGHMSRRSGLTPGGAYDVSWLDGALLMFRRGVLTQHPINETYFLYMEETDHHQTLQRHGWRVKISANALAWQHSSGIPPYYLTRNIQIFQARNGTRFQTVMSAPYLVVYSVTRDIIRRRGAATWRSLLRGWLEGRPIAAVQAEDRRGVIVINPLGGALSHYTTALRQHLADAGVEAEIRSIPEPSFSGTSRLTWLLHYIGLLVSAGQRSRQWHGQMRVLVTWPVLGFWDLLLIKFLCGSSGLVVYHDPKPLVRATGSSPWVSGLVRLVRNRPGVLVHSREAAHAMGELGLADGLSLVAHPVHHSRPGRQGRPPEGSRHGSRPRVRVLGQYKQDRDIELLESLAAGLGTDCEFEIVGRGWPTVKGWQVDSRFVSEVELDHLINTSDALIIPYKRFYQSGIAIRALEQSVPVVGRADTSLRDLYGAESPLLVKENGGSQNPDVDAWARSLEFALSKGQAEASCALKLYHERATRDWTSLIFNGLR